MGTRAAVQGTVRRNRDTSANMLRAANPKGTVSLEDTPRVQ